MQPLMLAKDTKLQVFSSFADKIVIYLWARLVAFINLQWRRLNGRQ